MDVFDDEDQRLLAGHGEDERLEGRNGTLADEVRRKLEEHLVLDRVSQEVVQVGDDGARLELEGGEARGDLALGVGFGVNAVQGEEGLNNFQEGEIGDAVAVGEAGAFEVLGALLYEPLF